MRKMLTIILVLLLMFGTSTLALAKGRPDGAGNHNSARGGVERNAKDKSAEVNEEEADEEVDEDENLNNSEWQQKKGELENAKDQAEVLKDELEEKYEAAKEEGNEELEKELASQLKQAKEDFWTAKSEFHNVVKAKREAIKASYTEKEMEQVNESANEIIKQHPEAKALFVDSLISHKGGFKFDTPPVIKGGRTLIPVRAITEGFGAEVSWDEETKMVTITKDDIEIVLPLDDSTVYVNGEEVQLDTKSEVMNSRTYLPLRFIVETLGYKISWDEETDTINIEDDEIVGEFEEVEAELDNETEVIEENTDENDTDLEETQNDTTI